MNFSSNQKLVIGQVPINKNARPSAHTMLTVNLSIIFQFLYEKLLRETEESDTV